MVRQQTLSLNGVLNFALLTGWMLLAGLVASPLVAQESKTDKKAYDLEQTAANAQNEKDYEFARKLWQEILDTYPESKASRKAWYNLGNCCYNLEDYGSAILAFKKALPIMQEDESPAIPEMLLALGYSRIMEGRRLAESDPDESSSQYTTAANDLNTVLLNHSDSPQAGAAAHYRGKAFEELGQNDDAKTAYEQSVEIQDNDLRIESMYALGRLSLKENEFEDAGRWYDRIRTVVDKEKGHPLLNDTNLNYAESLINFGIQQLKKDDIEVANKKFRDAKAILAEVIADEHYDARDDAIFLDASCSMYLGDDAKAAELFESVSQIKSSELREKALVLAGSSWLKAGDKDRGTAALKSAINSTSSFAVDAVHELALWLIDAGRSQEAFDLTEEWSTKIKGHPLEVDVLLDRANASRGVPELASLSSNLYADIASKYPSHPLAPKCLYWSAFSNYESNDYNKAIDQAKAFEEDYPGDELLAGMWEVLGDSLLMKGQHREAEAVFRNLATDFQGNKKDLSWWITRAGFASYLQGNFDETIQWLEKQDASITLPQHKAESLHWIGSSHFQNGQYEEAAEKLQQSLDIDRKWNRTPEVMLALVNAQLKLSKFDEAEQTATTMIEAFPKNPNDIVGRALYAVGDESLEVKQYDRAIRNFDLLATKFVDSELTPFAIYRAGYAAVENDDGEDAAKRFADFLEKYPKHELTQNATLGRTNALRMSGNTEESIAGLKQLVETATGEETIRKATYQLGLAYVDSGDWPNAVATFSSMTDALTADTPDADKVWYELAWAQRENGEPDDSLVSFAKLVEVYPTSTFAPEAHFLLGSQAYNEKDFDTAIEHYTAAGSDSARDEIREKSRYKLGWCHYKKEDFDAAGAQFKKQAEEFPNGKLYADGRYMIAQCAWRSNDFDEAFEAYTVAKPVIEEYSQLDERVKKYTSPTLLNGARAGNKTKNFVQAAEMAQALIEMPDVTESVKQEAQLEFGIAKVAIGELDAASGPLDDASLADGETGAHAKALLGDIFFKQAVDAAKAGDTITSKQRFNEAIEAYGNVYYGYGGSLAPAEVKSWQAYASYEAARCYMVQINEAKSVDKVILVGKAIDRYQYLVTRFPEHALAAEANKQISKLNALKEKFAN
ncbi:tetratricopeptide repeat protein [Mariniblastus fucicola]|uniref:Tol-pal system protein YbgF n=1 Tax=Mariniblastus fucicola TaxID=980251 RepID=A0A5B9P1D0_9BACT|nr:tetratricopeptide repeat protein [Mariniblastus fucicola]QEG20327.1 tol-pal system protein YbgF [Mariniblastus fucicola]